MSLLLLLLLLLGAPQGCADGQAAALTSRPVTEWQGECPPAGGTRSAGAGVVKGVEKG